MAKPAKTDLSDVIAFCVSGGMTWLIYHMNTPAGTEAQADFVAWYIGFMLVFSLLACGFEDETILRAAKRHPLLSAWTNVNTVVQVLLLMVTGHWWLFIAQSLSIAFFRGRLVLARERTEQAKKAALS